MQIDLLPTTPALGDGAAPLALRTLVKAGDAQSLEVLVCPNEPTIAVKNLLVEPDTVTIGKKLLIL